MDRPLGVRYIMAPPPPAMPALTMPTSLHDLVGFAAAIFTTASFIPQAIHSWVTRDLSGVSLWMYLLFTAGLLLWLVYGLMIGAWPIIVANTITLLLAFVVLYLKIKHR